MIPDGIRKQGMFLGYDESGGYLWYDGSVPPPYTNLGHNTEAERHSVKLARRKASRLRRKTERRQRRKR